MIEINRLCKRFESRIAVDDLSLVINEGEILGFLGPNGAGKSTTMKMLTGYLKPSSGTARIYGIDMHANGINGRKILGYLPEGAPSYAEMAVSSFLRFIADVRGVPKSKQDEALAAVVEKMHLDQVLEQPIESLSKGFKRRVGLAQAIIHDPKVLILDEPTDGLDPNQKYEVRNLIAGLAKDKIVIISTHILEEVSAVCTRAVIINHGKLVVDEKPEVLLQRSSSGRLDDVFRMLTMAAQ